VAIQHLPSSSSFFQLSCRICQQSRFLLVVTVLMVPSVMIKMILPSFEQKSCHMPSLWCLLLLSPVFFLSHHVFHQTTVHNNRCFWNHRSILHGVIAFTSEQTVLSHLQFPSLPTSFRVELLPIHVSFGCDTM